MKNLIHSAYSIVGGVSLVLAAGATTVSCSDFLEVPLESTVATSNFYKTAEEFDLGLTGVYNMLLSAEWANGDRYGSYFQGFLILGRVGTDEMIIPNNIDGNETELCNYTYTPSHRYISRTWYVQYRGIQRACVIIDRLTNTDIGNESEKNRILGEAYFLRAFYYFHLVRLFGEVPIINHEVTDLEMVRTEKASIAQVYEQIVSDLKQAIAKLPVSNANGRAHYYAAKAMLGKVYLQMAGQPLQDPNAAALAETELLEVIKSGRFALVTDYFSLFDASNEYSSEYLFDVEFANNGTTTYGGQVGTTDGVQTPNNLYWTAVWSTQEFYETFDPKDLRRDNIARFKYVYDDNQNLVKEDLSAEPIYYAYKFRHALTEEGRGAGWANWANPINFPIIRYADVLLMYAEAVWRAHGVPSDQALEYVNQVRRRGFGADIHTPDPEVDLKMMSGDEFGEALLAERSFELCFEGQRWYDLVRFGKLEEGVKKLAKYSSAATSQAQNFQPKHLFFPIPQDVIDASNGKIEQNPLWK
ncbi:RagB/SusD family nutrient uptake outer membrane protein [Alistipes sp. An54]|uniref:RagB/SusD family nutrient uptake outer membrane protein n=1 Tax=Alistipes sp. An54 TaxID=1965645 RepID=UPI000B365BD4|nr:RagB/SusD family nutrient uptake outer membrane protein [Alistipes sp. An54]OUN77809.1 RagB/SusD family nutrient uptake outer membrane protein [Alistipes sp. An54]